MDGELIKKSLCFHGKPMQKIWDDERGAGDLQKIGIPEDGNYAIYMDRQKYFTFQDRAKRLKLHQFLARKAVDLYDKDLGKSIIQSIKPKEEIEKAKQFMAEVPPYEIFIVKHQEKIKRHIYESIKTGDIIYATIPRNKLSSTKFGLTVNAVCTGEPKVQLLQEYKLKAHVSNQLCGTVTTDKSPKARNNDNNEYLRCEVVEFSIDAERLTLSLLGNSKKNKNLKLGLITLEEMPQLYRKISENKLEKFDECLRKAKEFENPNYEVLYTINGLDVNDSFSLMTNLKYDFPRQEYAKELRQVQASKWAFRSVAEGIEYFKIGEHVEAFQCLNKALNIDPRNVEGLVARGALYANKGSFLKAVEDFEKALKLNAYHVNARKYMGETLVALGRSYEEDNRIQEAAKAYRDCLNIIPNHEQARLSLEVIQQRTGASVEPIIKRQQLSSLSKYDSTLQQQLQEFEQQQGIVVDSSSNDGESSENSSGSETEASDDIFSMAKKDASLSPLSKKMVLHSVAMDQQQPAQFNQPFYMAQATSRIAKNVSVIANEFKLDDDDTESRVQKLLQEAIKHKKEKKKTKKLKKSKKSKKESKSKDTSSILEKINFQEAYNILGGGLKIESTLNDNLKLYEHTIQEIRKRQEALHQTPPTDVAATSRRARSRQRSETPPPPPLHADLPTSSTYVYKTLNFGRNNSYSSAPKVQTAPEAPKLSFQIKKPIKVDKFGLIRLATPALENSPTPPPTHIKRRSQSPRSRIGRRSHERSNGKRRRSHSRSPRNRSYRGGNLGEGPNYRRHRRSSSNSRSRSKSYSRNRKRLSRSTSRSNSRRHSPSPFVPRGTPSPNSRYRRSRSPNFNRRHVFHDSRSPRSQRDRSPERKQFFPKFGNRTWKRPDFKPRVPAQSDGKWLHDKFEEKNDGPSIEEIDEIISKAQKERKQDIISRDKNILKKTNRW